MNDRIEIERFVLDVAGRFYAEKREEWKKIFAESLCLQCREEDGASEVYKWSTYLGAEFAAQVLEEWLSKS